MRYWSFAIAFLLTLALAVAGFFLDDAGAPPASVPAAIESPAIDRGEYLLYVPGGINGGGKYPLVVALSPSADADSMIAVWRPIADRHRWIILASKVSRNGVDIAPVAKTVLSDVAEVEAAYPVDKAKIIFTGLSGGGMASHYFSYEYPDMVSAIVVNTGMLAENYSMDSPYAENKTAVFLASPTDFRYTYMQRDKLFLDSKGWRTRWIEFEGGHTFAPQSAYEEAAEWLEESLKGPDDG
jgi:predicted esterase